MLHEKRKIDVANYIEPQTALHCPIAILRRVIGRGKQTVIGRVTISAGTTEQAEDQESEPAQHEPVDYSSSSADSIQDKHTPCNGGMDNVRKLVDLSLGIKHHVSRRICDELLEEWQKCCCP